MATSEPSAGDLSAGADGRREAIAATAKRERTPSVREQAEKLVYTWPHLVLIEFISAMLMLLSLLILGWIVNAPLESVANPDRTPNPSKAPWYFLNLQELLLHMHPALAGVIVPGAVVFALLPALPYIDRDQRDVGKWFGTPNALPIFYFTSVFTTVVLILEILFDEFVGVRPMMQAIASATGLGILTDVVFTGIIIPLILMLGPIPVLIFLLNKRFGPLSTRDVMIALFTGFVIAFFVLTIVGTFFRGQGMHLYWPWDPAQIRVE